MEDPSLNDSLRGPKHRYIFHMDILNLCLRARRFSKAAKDPSDAKDIVTAASSMLMCSLTVGPSLFPCRTEVS